MPTTSRPLSDICKFAGGGPSHQYALAGNHTNRDAGQAFYLFSTGFIPQSVMQFRKQGQIVPGNWVFDH